jgi:hypothetical protein
MERYFEDEIVFENRPINNEILNNLEDNEEEEEEVGD